MSASSVTLIFEKIDAARPGKMGKRETVTVILSAILVISWLLPGFLSFLAPTAAFTGWMNMITMLTPLLAVIVFHGRCPH